MAIAEVEAKRRAAFLKEQPESFIKSYSPALKELKHTPPIKEYTKALSEAASPFAVALTPERIKLDKRALEDLKAANSNLKQAFPNETSLIKDTIVEMGSRLEAAKRTQKPEDYKRFYSDFAMVSRAVNQLNDVAVKEERLKGKALEAAKKALDITYSISEFVVPPVMIAGKMTGAREERIGKVDKAMIAISAIPFVGPATRTAKAAMLVGRAVIVAEEAAQAARVAEEVAALRRMQAAGRALAVSPAEMTSGYADFARQLKKGAEWAIKASKAAAADMKASHLGRARKFAFESERYWGKEAEVLARDLAAAKKSGASASKIAEMEKGLADVKRAEAGAHEVYVNAHKGLEAVPSVKPRMTEVPQAREYKLPDFSETFNFDRASITASKANNLDRGLALGREAVRKWGMDVAMIDNSIARAKGAGALPGEITSLQRSRNIAMQGLRNAEMRLESMSQSYLQAARIKDETAFLARMAKEAKAARLPVLKTARTATFSTAEEALKTFFSSAEQVKLLNLSKAARSEYIMKTVLGTINPERLTPVQKAIYNTLAAHNPQTSNIGVLLDEVTESVRIASKGMDPAKAYEEAFVFLADYNKSLGKVANSLMIDATSRITAAGNAAFKELSSVARAEYRKMIPIEKARGRSGLPLSDYFRHEALGAMTTTRSSVPVMNEQIAQLLRVKEKAFKF
ncbi:Uncharacterised protein [uncultured archaeon]|nr:Uncharacterised protein [uncultured archaeon]